MARRLLLGCSPVGNALVERARKGNADLLAVTDDGGWASTLRDRNVATVEADPTNPAAYPDGATTVFVASDDPERNVAAARAARERYPGATLVAHAGTAATDERVATLESVADRVIDPVDAVADRVRHAIDVDDADPDESGGSAADEVGGPAADDDERPPRLLATLRDLSGPLLVVTHDNPDPDAIASAIGLARIAERVGVPADPCYGGAITHQENRAMVNLLDLSLRTFEEIDLDDYGGVALVDHSRAGINDSLPEGTPVDVVIDHHPPRGPVEGRFIDIRPEAGATGTLIEEYLSRLEIEPNRALATTLLYGIRIDTRDFTREVSVRDFEAAASLILRADVATLERVESPSMGPETFRVLATAIECRDVRDSAIASCVGEIADRDALAQASERLLGMEGIAVTFVYSYMDGVIYGSARARGTDRDVGELLRDALGGVGSAGGHVDMAGAQVPLGILEDVPAATDPSAAVEKFVSRRFFEAIEDPPSQPAEGVPTGDGAEFPD